jgi:hypothetical protein
LALIAFASLSVCFTLIASAVWGTRYLAEKKIGYCFDVAFDPAKNRLFVAAGAAGLHIFDVSAGTLGYTSTYYDGGYTRNLQLSDGRAYVADSDRGLVVLDVKGRIPVTLWEQDTTMGLGIHLEENRAYLAAGEAGLYIFGLANPDWPQLLGQTKTAGSAWDVWVHNGYAYVADVDQGITVVDVSSAQRPRRIGFITWDEANPLAEIVRGEGDTVYVAAACHGLIVIDVSRPAHPVLASIYPLARDGWAEGLAVQDSLVYLAVGNRRDRGENGLHILDAQDPYGISAMGKLSFPDWVEGVHVADDVAYVSNTFSGARSIDIQLPHAPRLIDSFTLGEWLTRHLRSALGVDGSLQTYAGRWWRPTRGDEMDGGQ